MSRHDDDTLLDALAAQVRSHGPLSAERAEDLIGAAHAGDTSARDALVEHSLAAVLAEAVAHRDRGVDVVDLYQEGSLATTVAVDEYVGRLGSGAKFGPYVRRVIGTHLDTVVEHEQALLAEEQAIVRDARMLEAAELRLRERFGRPATDIEVAAVLEWAPERVELVSQMLAAAREAFDAEIVPYLDDEEAEG